MRLLMRELWGGSLGESLGESIREALAGVVEKHGWE